MSALAIAADGAVQAQGPRPVSRTASGGSDLMFLVDRGGRIRWMNQEARVRLGPLSSAIQLLNSRRTLPPLVRFPLGTLWLWLGNAGSSWRWQEAVRQANRLLWEAYWRRGVRNLDLSRAGGRLDSFLERVARRGARRRASAELIEALEAERGRIARELHDNAGQSLAGIGLNLELAERQIGSSNAEVVARLTRSRELAGLALEQIRRISHELHPPEWAKEEFSEAADWLVESMGLRSELDVEVGCADLPGGLSPTIQTVLYRTLQEALTNVVRHARARRVTIQTASTARDVRLTVEDDGQGFDPAARPGRGIGLANMRRRLGSVGGRLEIRSAPGEGTRVTAIVPREGAATG